VDINKLILKFIWKEKTQNSNTILKEDKVGGLTLHDVNTYQKATVIETVEHCRNNRQMDQWNRTESLEIDPHKYGH